MCVTYHYIGWAAKIFMLDMLGFGSFQVPVGVGGCGSGVPGSGGGWADSVGSLQQLDDV